MTVNVGSWKRLLAVAVVTLLVDQLLKYAVQRSLDYGEERLVLDGFFSIVHWGNKGAAWSLFSQFPASNFMLGILGLGALLLLVLTRHHFDVHTSAGQIALGLIFGGIVGNLIDRVVEGHVIDFLYFYLKRRGGGTLGFPAFNIADTAICTGVVLLFLLSLQKNESPQGTVSAGRRG